MAGQITAGQLPIYFKSCPALVLMHLLLNSIHHEACLEYILKFPGSNTSICKISAFKFRILDEHDQLYESGSENK